MLRLFVVLSILLVGFVSLSSAQLSDLTISLPTTGNRTLWTSAMFPGRKCAIIFVHGLFGSSMYWAHQYQEWSTKCTTIVFDLYGHGQSTGILAKKNNNVFVDDIATVVKFSKASKIILVGWSHGGLGVQQYTDSNPSKVIALVLVDALIRSPNPYRLGKDQVIVHTLALIKFTQGSLISVAKALLSPTDPHSLPFGFWEYATGSALTTNYRAVNQLVLTNISFVNNNFKKPVLIVYGTEDAIIDTENWVALQSAYNNSKTVAINGASHASFFDHPEQFNVAFASFIDSLSI